MSNCYNKPSSEGRHYRALTGREGAWPHGVAAVGRGRTRSGALQRLPPPVDGRGQTAGEAYLAVVRSWPRISPPGETFVWTFAYAAPARMAVSTAARSPASSCWLAVAPAMTLAAVIV